MNTNDIFLTQEKEINKFQIGDFVFHYRTKILFRENNSQKLTHKEAELLKLFYDKKNKILTREFLLNNIWEKNDYFLGRSMDVYITRLRKYLSYDKRISIINIRTIGYIFSLNDKAI